MEKQSDKKVLGENVKEVCKSVNENKECNGGKFLTFFLGKEEYGIEISRVNEIIGVLPITEVPRTPSFIKGVINLRGKIIPVIDLRLKFAMDAAEQTEVTCIIVLEAFDSQIGVIVDRVSEVLDIPKSSIDDVPDFGVNINIEYLLGIGKSKGEVKLLLDIDEVLSSKNVFVLSSA